LKRAAQGGAQVVVRVEGRPPYDRSGTLRSSNARAVRALREAGADAKLADGPRSNLPGMHMKALVCDGVAYLDDRNFTSGGDEAVIRDDRRADVDAVIDAACGKPHRALRSFWTTKSESLAAQGRLLKSATHAQRVDVETEAFSLQSAAYAGLKRLAAAGVRCRLIVSKRDLNANAVHAVALLRRAGVEVRAAEFNGKVAIVDGKRAWAGSANATSPYLDPDQTDWAIRTSARAVVHGLESRFERHWRAGKAIQ
jgi:phosphatidylserine/phosphatidylglycerophosphate/cardiolipin synthase-like enzyme